MDPFDTGVDVRLDGSAMAAEAAQLQAVLRDLGQVGEDVGRGLEASFDRFVRTGKLSFQDLRRTAVGALDDIYTQAITAGLDALFGGASGGGILGSIFRTPGIAGFGSRAIGGGVEAGRPYLVGENGPEMFFPGRVGRVEPFAQQVARPISIAVNVTTQSGGAGELRQSAGQVAAAVGRAVSRAQRNL